MKKHTAWIAALLCLLALTGCRAAPDSGSEGSKTASIPFQEDQLYAVAYLGYGRSTISPSTPRTIWTT